MIGSRSAGGDRGRFPEGGGTSPRMTRMYTSTSGFVAFLLISLEEECFIGFHLAIRKGWLETGRHVTTEQGNTVANLGIRASASGRGKGDRPCFPGR